jgi:proteasome accessory factor B
VAKLDRLLNLTAALLDARVPMTAEEIRTRVPGYSQDSDEAFHRAFERDKDDLRELGIPVETVSVGHHEQPRAAYTIERDRYELPDPGFEVDELAAIQLAATAVQGLRKLGGLQSTDGAATRPTGGAPLGAVPTPDGLLELFVAVLERRQVTFDYGRPPVVRTVQPHRLQFERGRWYLTGHDVDRDAHRSFRLDRIVGPIHSGDRDAFAPPQDVPAVRLRPWELGEGEPVIATVALDAVARSVLNEDPGLHVAQRHDDGSVEIELTVRNPEALRNFVLTLLDRGELLGPADLRADLVRWLERFGEDAA